MVAASSETVRRAAGLQATLLNQIVDELFKEHHLFVKKLAELLGSKNVRMLYTPGREIR